MIQIDDKIVSTEILTTRFCCDLPRCKGICCVEGNAGAHRSKRTKWTRSKRNTETYKPYMKPEGIEAVERQGFMVIDEDGDYTTPLIGEAECAYRSNQDGITFCAIERAYNAGKTTFIKPISCHLYPIRLIAFGNGSVGLNYHRWNVCHDALALGREKGLPMYRMLQGSSDPSFRGRVLRCTVFSSTIS